VQIADIHYPEDLPVSARRDEILAAGPETYRHWIARIEGAPAGGKA